MSKLAEYLNRQIVGNVFERASVCDAYATDRSFLKYTPKLVACPENASDVQRLLRFVYQLSMRKFKLPVTVRGAGLDKTGAAIGSGLILSTERMDRIEEVDVRGRLVRVQPGVSLGNLNNALRLSGLCLPIGYDPRATIGGLIAGCPTDDMSARHGGIYRFVEKVEIVLANGDLIQLSPYSQRAVEEKKHTGGSEAMLYRRIENLLDDQADVILDRSMQPFNAAGFANIIRVREGGMTNLLPLLFASQGTLGVITDIILKVEPLPSSEKRLLASFHDLNSAAKFLNFAMDYDPCILQVYDLKILEEATSYGKRSALFPHKLGKGLLVMVGFDHGAVRNSKAMRDCVESLPYNVLHVEEDDTNSVDFRALDNLLMSYLNDGASARLPVMDEVRIPAPNFLDFLKALKVLEEEFGLDLPIFGSFATASYNVRPSFNLARSTDCKKMLEFMQVYMQTVNTCGGSITGNAPEGRTKAVMTLKSLGVGERQVYSAIKEAFDPQGIMNPGVKFGATMREIVGHLRDDDGRVATA